MIYHQCPIDAAIIDLDGTMVDTLGDFVAAINLMLADLRLAPSPAVLDATVVRMVGKGSEHLIRSVLAHLCEQQAGLADKVGGAAVYEHAYASYQRHYAGINGRFSGVYPGVVEGLKALRKGGLKLACLTNKPTAFARELLELKGLDKYFGVVFGGDAFEHKKPHPLPLLKTCESLSTPASRTLMVGDSTNDAQAARAAGCPVVLVTYGYNHGEPIHGVDADGYIDSLAQLDLKSART
jgi:phosphoglycolate phosphatase